MPQVGTGKHGWFGRRGGSGTALGGQADPAALAITNAGIDRTTWPAIRSQVSVLVANGNARVLETTVMAHDLSRGELLVLAPVSDDATFATIRGRVAFVEWTSTAGFHQLEGIMLDVAQGVLPMWRIEVAEEPEVVNRRRFLRVRKAGPVPLSVGSVEIEATVINISEGGLRFEVPSDTLVTGLVEPDDTGAAADLDEAPGEGLDAPRPQIPGLGKGARLELSIDLGTEGLITAGGRVEWVRRSNRQLEVGVSFDSLPEAKVRILRRHIFSLQRTPRGQRRN